MLVGACDRAQFNFHGELYEDQNLGEIGWKIIISREPENFDDEWSGVTDR